MSMPSSLTTVKQITTIHLCVWEALTMLPLCIRVPVARCRRVVNIPRSFSGFLNCLDGLGAPDDVVIFMTTNHPDKLVPAPVLVN